MKNKPPDMVTAATALFWLDKCQAAERERDALAVQVRELQDALRKVDHVRQP